MLPCRKYPASAAQSKRLNRRCERKAHRNKPKPLQENGAKGSTIRESRSKCYLIFDVV